ncbi:hypothetical protein [Streptomyces sp. CRN 30]|uniref:hypothetical protein n=1 Tax=Streptomyces sp. CRN 30 TaxID=3075613 RepID=UPI002A7FEB02|nr:hypothetical protein [Streptomyces sp. CRN 30]
MTEADVARSAPRQLAELSGVYDFLDEIRLRPGMWVHRSSLLHLDSMLTGYRVALGVHDIEEPFDFWTPGGSAPFSEWLWQRLGYHSSLRWAAEIERVAKQENRPALKEFFELLDEFRAVHHNPHDQDQAEPDAHSSGEAERPSAAD